MKQAFQKDEKMFILLELFPHSLEDTHLPICEKNNRLRKPVVFIVMFNLPVQKD